MSYCEDFGAFHCVIEGRSTYSNLHKLLSPTGSALSARQFVYERWSSGVRQSVRAFPKSLRLARPDLRRDYECAFLPMDETRYDDASRTARMG